MRINVDHRKWKDVGDVKSAQEDHELAVDAWLTARGWKHTSSTPGSLWLWQREYEGRVLLVNTATALHMQAWFDMVRCNCAVTSDKTPCAVHGRHKLEELGG